MKTATLKLRMTPEELADWKDQAKRSGASLSEWIRVRLSSASMAQHTVIVTHEPGHHPTSVIVEEPHTHQEGQLPTQGKAKRFTRQAKSAEPCEHGARRELCKYAECRRKR